MKCGGKFSSVAISSSGCHLSTVFLHLDAGRRPFSGELRKRVARKTALREIARAYLAGAGMTVLGETARASGLSRVEAGSGNHQLVDEGYAIRLRQGIYALASSKNG